MNKNREVIQIIKDGLEDKTFIFIYETMNNCNELAFVGVNYYCGVEQTLEEYFVVDTKLTERYEKRFPILSVEKRIEALKECIEEILLEENSALFEESFQTFLEDYTMRLDYKNKKERDKIQDVVNMVLNKIDTE